MAKTYPADTCLVVYVTMPDKTAALAYCETLIRERLAACANILDNATSVYWWNNSLETSTECVCVFKTTGRRFDAFAARARETHPYEVPCITAWPIADGNPDFLRWIRGETSA